jgi:hypothetical protein
VQDQERIRELKLIDQYNIIYVLMLSVLRRFLPTISRLSPSRGDHVQSDEWFCLLTPERETTRGDLVREVYSCVGQLDHGDVVAERGEAAEVGGVLEKLIRKQNLSAFLVTVEVVHANVDEGTVGAEIIREGPTGDWRMLTYQK